MAGKMGGSVADVRIHDVTALLIEWRAGDPGAMDPDTVMRDWKFAKNWLLRELSRTKRPLTDDSWPSGSCPSVSQSDP